MKKGGGGGGINHQTHALQVLAHLRTSPETKSFTTDARAKAQDPDRAIFVSGLPKRSAEMMGRLWAWESSPDTPKLFQGLARSFLNPCRPQSVLCLLFGCQIWFPASGIPWVHDFLARRKSLVPFHLLPPAVLLSSPLGLPTMEEAEVCLRTRPSLGQACCYDKQIVGFHLNDASLERLCGMASVPWKSL